EVTASISQASPLSSRRTASSTSRWSSATRMRARSGRFFMARNLASRGSRRQPTVAQLEAATAVVRILFVVRYLDDGRTLPVQLLEQFHDHRPLRGMQGAGRLVGQDHL